MRLDLMPSDLAGKVRELAGYDFDLAGGHFQILGPWRSPPHGTMHLEHPL